MATTCFAEDYEFLIRVKDKESGLSLKGDCITFKLVGWDWGKNERKHYAIIRKDDITYEQAYEVCNAKYITGYEENEDYEEGDGADEFFKIENKKHYFDLDTLITSEKLKDCQDKEKSVEPIKVITTFNSLFKDREKEAKVIE